MNERPAWTYNIQSAPLPSSKQRTTEKSYVWDYNRQQYTTTTTTGSKSTGENVGVIEGDMSVNDPLIVEPSTNKQEEVSRKNQDNEVITLVGSARVKPFKGMTSLKTQKIVALEGLGNNLSGNYMITETNVTLDSSSGFSFEMQLRKTGFERASMK